MPEPEVALTEALQWVADEPDCADAHYDLGLAYEALEREEERRREMLTVLSLDSRSGSGTLPDDVICDEVEMTLAELPPALEERLGPVAILIEPRPSRQLVEEGIDARILASSQGQRRKSYLVPTRRLPPRAAPGVANPLSVMVAGYGLLVTDWDQWMLRHTWSKLKARWQ